MKRMILGGVLAAFLPVAALAHDGIDVRVSLAGGPGWGEEETWIEFEAERDAFVAVYATFSDGSFEMVFPVSDQDDHWVDGHERYAVPVYSRRGVYLEDVQAIASANWFDPAECWLAYDHGYDWRAPRVLVATVWPTWSWGFSFAWSSPSRCWTPVRRCDWYTPRCDYGIRFERSWYRTATCDWNGSWDYHGWDGDRNRSWSREKSAVRHAVKGDVRRPDRKSESWKARTESDRSDRSVRKSDAVRSRPDHKVQTTKSSRDRKVQSAQTRPERGPERKVQATKERSPKKDVVKANGAQREAGKDRSAKSNSVRWTAGGGAKAKAAPAPGKKSSSSRGSSGEPKRRSGR